ncbi:MAG: methyltransferase domain-containing protein [Thalassobaculaceae bacterium]|nr:methyltransferase domain-containing protein [Thalassobaculaceae bacterium]
MSDEPTTREAGGEGAAFDFEDEDEPDPVWPRAKMEVSQRVFGRGFIIPGGPEHVIDIVKSLGLDPVQSVLDISMGLGGPGAAMAAKYGVWITGYERNPALFEQSASVLATIKSGDQVRSNFLDPETFDLPRKKFDAVLSTESMHRVQDRIALIGKVRNTLKDWGQFLLIDYVLPDESQPSERLMTWLRSRGEPVTLWTRQQYEVALSNQGLDIRVIKDESGAHVEMIRRDFAEFVSTLNANKAVTGTEIGKAALMDLAEDWSRLASLLQDGELQLLRFLAMKPEET